MIRKLSSGGYRLYSRKKNPKTGKRRNLGTFKTRAAAEQHEKEQRERWDSQRSSIRHGITLISFVIGVKHYSGGTVSFGDSEVQSDRRIGKRIHEAEGFFAGQE